MKIKVVVSESVKLDLLEAASWYENAKKGLGKTFLLHIRKEKNRIAKNPTAFEIRYDSIRIAFTKRFPYGIHYEFIEEAALIIIHAIFHTSINPDSWKK
ncbi:MAG: type II toxin-antitoxin system RelE/ParE family toxin [Flavobacterium sp.]